MFSLLLPKGFFYKRRIKDSYDVIIKDGILIQGRLTKRDVGRSSNGLIDHMLRQFGPFTAVVFLSAVQRALGVWIERTGFSMGIQDCLIGDPDDPLQKIEGQSGQDIIDNIVKDVKIQVEEELSIELFSEVEKKKQESKVRSILSLARDKIMKIVRSGGRDISKANQDLEKESSRSEFIETLVFSRDNIEDQTISDSLDDFINLIKHEIIKKRKKRNISDLDEDRILLEKVIPLIKSMEVDKFKQSANFGKSGESLRVNYLTQLNDAYVIRSKLVGADKFDNNFLRVVLSGAKGTEMNIGQVLGIVGQQEVKGQRAEALMTDGTRTTAHVSRGSKDPESQGFCSSSYSKGLNPTETFMHAWATRANVVESNLMPGVTGYLYRRLALKLENKVTTPDQRVVDVNGRTVSFAYGGDGMDPRRLTVVNGIPQFVNVSNVTTLLTLTN